MLAFCSLPFMCDSDRISHVSPLIAFACFGLEGLTGTIGTPRDCQRESQRDSQDAAEESLGCTPNSRRVAETRHRRREQCHQVHGAHRKSSSQTWRSFLDNHISQFVFIVFFTVPTIRFQVLYVFLVLAHDRRRRILHFNVPTIQQRMDRRAAARNLSL